MNSFSCAECIPYISARKLRSGGKGNSTSLCKRNKKRVERDPGVLRGKGWEGGGVRAVALKQWPQLKHIVHGDTAGYVLALNTRHTFYETVLALTA